MACRMPRLLMPSDMPIPRCSDARSNPGPERHLRNSVGAERVTRDSSRQLGSPQDCRVGTCATEAYGDIAPCNAIQMINQIIFIIKYLLSARRSHSPASRVKARNARVDCVGSNPFCSWRRRCSPSSSVSNRPLQFEHLCLRLHARDPDEQGIAEIGEAGPASCSGRVVAYSAPRRHASGFARGTVRQGPEARAGRGLQLAFLE